MQIALAPYNPHAMPDRTRTAGILAVVLALTAYAYAPLLAAGFLGEDREVLASVAAAEGGGVGELYRVDGTESRPLAALSLELSAALWSDGGRWTGVSAAPLWIENLVLLVLAAWGLVGVLRRALVPWLGEDPAKAAGHAGAALVLMHPLAVAGVGRVASRGDLLLLALGAWAARLFLAGRQERRADLCLGAWGLTVLAGLASPLAVFLPPVLTGLEYLSTRRHRPLVRRLQTALTTWVAFALAAHLEWLGRLALAPQGLRALLHLPDGAGTPTLFLEKLGVLMLPVNTYGIGSAGYVFAGLVVLVALHPGFVAARSAPRLWGRIVIGWGASIAATLALHAPLRVPPGGLGGAHVLLPAALVMGVGFGISSTALSGWRRTVVPAAAGALFAILGRAAALPHQWAGAAVAELRQELVDEAAARRWDVLLIVLDPPRQVAGLDVLGSGLDSLLAPPFLPRAVDASRLEVHGVSTAGFLAWSREEEFAAVRERGACVIVGGGMQAIDLPQVEGAGEPRATWLGEGRTPGGLVLDPLRARSFRVSALPEVSTDAPPVIRWSSGGEVSDGVEVTGVWLAGPDTPIAAFDMGAHLPWLLSGRVRSTWFTGSLSSIVTARVGPDPQPLPDDVLPHPVGQDGGDWLFDVSAVSGPDPISGAATWRLGLLDLATLEHSELAPALDAGGRLRFEGAATWVEAAYRSGGPIVWTLDRRVEGVTVARASRRRAARAPAPTEAGE